MAFLSSRLGSRSVSSMEVSNLLVSEAHALGMDEGLASQLTKILEPLIEALREPHDLGLWLFNEEKCETVCQELEENLQGDGPVLLWKVASRLKQELKGIVSVHCFCMFFIICCIVVLCFSAFFDYLFDIKLTVNEQGAPEPPPIHYPIKFM